MDALRLQLAAVQSGGGASVGGTPVSAKHYSSPGGVSASSPGSAVESLQPKLAPIESELERAKMERDKLQLELEVCLLVAGRPRDPCLSVFCSLY